MLTLGFAYGFPFLRRSHLVEIYVNQMTSPHGRELLQLIFILTTMAHLALREHDGHHKDVTNNTISSIIAWNIE